MFLISTLCLLALAVWLFMNALNERRWVEAHTDEQTEIADEGLVPSYSRLKRSAEPKGRYSINQADGKVSRMAARIKEKTANMSAAIEQKVAVPASDESITSSGKRSLSEIGTSITGSDSIVGKAAEKLSKISASIPVAKIDPTTLKKNSSEQEATGPISSRIQNVRDRLDQIQSKVDG